MSKIQRIILKQRVIPAIILFGLLPRSVFYTSTLSVMSYILTGALAVLSLAYLLIRCIAVIKYIDYKGLIIFDTLCVIVGSIVACVYNRIGCLTLLFCVTSIPLNVDNYKVLIKIGQLKDV